MNKLTANKTFLVLFVLLLLIFIDRATKILAMWAIGDDFFVLSYSFFKPRLNAAMAFSLPAPKFFIYVLSGVVIVYLCWWLVNLYKQKKYSQVFFLTLLIYSGLSNLFDRIFYGGVVDFIYLEFFPLFNFADIYITIAVIFLIYFNFKKEKKYEC